MELLLNLVWLGLALPAIWMWRRSPVFASRTGWLRKLQPFLLFACVLMLLFPVVSATDDLHAVRQEIEESSPSKRMVKAASGEKSVTPPVGMNSPAIVVLAFSSPYGCEACGRVWGGSLIALRSPDGRPHAGRSPPSLLA